MKRSRKRLLFVLGTRPEAIKLAPVLQAARRPGSGYEVCLATTGQHSQMLRQALDQWGLIPDHDLRLMRPGQTLAGFFSRALAGLDRVMAETRPDLVMVQGDTSSAWAAGLAAFYRRHPVAHVEAGLRTHDLAQPFPEEANRRLISVLAAWHFAATPLAERHLLEEGVPAERIFVTGNPVVDALQSMLPAGGRPGSSATVLVTAHRRENFGPGLSQICQAVARLARRFPDLEFIFPVHRNPAVRGIVGKSLGAGLPNLRLVAPMPYPAFIRILARARLVLTDSGGIQEEAPALGVPALVLRQVTERPEALKAGCLLVPPEKRAIFETAEKMLRSGVQSKPAAACPFGDGKAAARIVAALDWIFGRRNRRPKPFVPKPMGLYNNQPKAL